MPISEIDRHLGERIANARQAAGVAPEKLAEQIEIDAQALSKLEAGNMRVSALVLARVARALSTPLSWFYSGLPGQQVFDASTEKRRSV